MRAVEECQEPWTQSNPVTAPLKIVSEDVVMPWMASVQSQLYLSYAAVFHWTMWTWSPSFTLYRNHPALECP